MLYDKQMLSVNGGGKFHVLDAIDYLSSGNFRFERF